MEVLEGAAWVFGDHVTTDDIFPGRYLERPLDEAGRYAMAGVDETFASRVRPGDFVVGGVNFGAGSSREAAVVALKQAGVAAVIARSFARIFFRNAINNGLPAVIVPDTTGIRTGDRLRVDLTSRQVTVLRTGSALPILNLTGISLAILRAGGLIPFTEARLSRRTP
ncbi:MAG: 3-isopropylmalate dehydratase small subunit [Armatimonadota bacterium]|nr:3-isopropylmalate dehydratase small subunit [Armatimonadota bacterium]MDW8157012.1 3-isopropylmalate dehydratase small subunit [Armatimonadota bacterium]